MSFSIANTIRYLLIDLGISLTCPPNNKHVNNTNSYTVIDASKRTIHTGAISPTSDFLEDSCISEDNGSSVNSNSDQGISIYCAETPTKLYQYSHQNNNNNISNKNLNHNNNDGQKTPTIIHLSLAQSPDKTIEVVKTINGSMNGNKMDIILDCSNNKNSNESRIQTDITTTTAATTTASTTTSSTPHQHFHKKYLREEHNKVLQQLNSETTVTCTTTNRYVSASKQLC